MPINVEPIGDTVSVYTAEEVDAKLAALPSGVDAEAVQDAVAALLQQGAGVTLNYDDAANVLTITAFGVSGALDPEAVRDVIGVALVGISPIRVETNDAGDTITISCSAYVKPTDGIPRTDLSADVTDSLDRADNSVQGDDPRLNNVGGAVDKSKWPITNIQNYNIRNDGSSNSLVDLTNAYNAARSSGNQLFIGPGVFNLPTMPGQDDWMQFVGVGPKSSIIRYTGRGIFKTYTAQGISYSGLGFELADPAAVFFELSGSFRFSFTSCIWQGNYYGAAEARVQTGIRLDKNTGATNFYNSNFQNLGVGVQTSCIQNDLFGGKINNCWRSIWLDASNPFNAGLNVFGTELIGGGSTITDVHLLCDGAANSVNLEDVWCEQSNRGMVIGVAGVGGPSSFKMNGCKIGVGPNVGLQLNHCRQPTINCLFDVDKGYVSAPEMVINSGNCPEGIALNCITTLPNRDDIPLSTYPVGWTVVGRKYMRPGGVLRLPTYSSPPSAFASGAGAVIFNSALGRQQTSNGSVWI